MDGHAAWVNTKALEMADVNAATKEPEGGRVHRDSAGRPTGVLIDRAMGLVSRRIPPADKEQIKQRLARAAQECARLGLTSVHDAGVFEQDLTAYRELIAEKRLPLRVYAMIRGESALWVQYLARGPEIGPRLTVRSIKLMADGALGSRGAALKEPYSDEPANRGLMITDQKAIERVARAAVSTGFQVNTHAIGDRANRAVLDAYAAALGGRNDRRFRVEHAQVVSLEDIPLFAKYSVIASMQATHATSDMRWAELRLGPQRVLGAYAWQRYLKLGVPVANGSDFPVEDANPLWGFYASVTRQDHAGSPTGGWMPAERMSRDEALRSWTAAGAFAAFEEKEKGTLTPGKVADFVMLSADIMEAAPLEVLKARVTMTVLDGEVVYREGNEIWSASTEPATVRERLAWQCFVYCRERARPAADRVVLFDELVRIPRSQWRGLTPVVLRAASRDGGGRLHGGQRRRRGPVVVMTRQEVARFRDGIRRAPWRRRNLPRGQASPPDHAAGRLCGAAVQRTEQRGGAAVQLRGRLGVPFPSMSPSSRGGCRSSSGGSWWP